MGNQVKMLLKQDEQRQIPMQVMEIRQNEMLDAPQSVDGSVFIGQTVAVCISKDLA